MPALDSFALSPMTLNLKDLLERISNINDFDSGERLRPDFKALMGLAGRQQTILETRSRKTKPVGPLVLHQGTQQSWKNSSNVRRIFHTGLVVSHRPLLQPQDLASVAPLLLRAP